MRETKTGLVAALLVMLAATLVACPEEGATNCSEDESLCGAGTVCDTTTNTCIPDCRDDTSVCATGTTCDDSTGQCTPDGTAGDCRDDATLCGDGTTCDEDTGHCVAEGTAGDCRVDATLCEAGTSCDDTTGHCVADPADCRVDSTACGHGTECDVDTGECVPLLPGDCRLDMTGICELGELCNLSTGECEEAENLRCDETPGLCWEDQTCDTDTGYCVEATINDALDYDVQVYDLTIDLNTTESSFTAAVDIFLIATSDGTSQIVLDVGNEYEIKEEDLFNPYVVSAVADGDGTALTYTQNSQEGTLTIELASAIDSGAGVVLHIEYAGGFNPITDDTNPYYATGMLADTGKYKNTIIQTFGWPIHTRRWLPSHDHPSDIARFMVDVGIDNDFTLISNGVMVEEDEAANRRTFVLRQPVPVYAFQVLAGDFEVVDLGVVDGVQIDAYVYPQDVPYAFENYAAAVGAFSYYTDILGTFPFEHYSMIEVPSTFGGMEHATIVSIADTDVEPDGYARETGIHELTHHWFGDVAHQENWNDFWLNESLASFLTGDAIGILSGPEAYWDFMDVRRFVTFLYYFVFDDDALHYSTEQSYPGEMTYASFNAPYYIGPWIWHTIRFMLGDEAFDEFLRDFYENHRFATYSTEDLLTELNAVGDIDFATFFAEWIDIGGWPQITINWRYNSTNEEIELTVDQVQDPDTYGVYTFDGPLALDFVFDDSDDGTESCTGEVTFIDGSTTESVQISCAYQPVRMTTPFVDNMLIEIVPDL